jgi:hypothetical protein
MSKQRQARDFVAELLDPLVENGVQFLGELQGLDVISEFSQLIGQFAYSRLSRSSETNPLAQTRPSNDPGLVVPSSGPCEATAYGRLL